MKGQFKKKKISSYMFIYMVSILRNATTNKTTFPYKFDCVLLIYEMLHK